MKLENLLVVSGLILPLSGCAAIQPEMFSGPNGRVAYHMECSGMGRTLGDCYKKAGEICPQGYQVLDNSSDLVGIPVNGTTMLATKRSIAIECK
ncbi:hypothetical protein ACQ0MK_04245 [Thalassospira lucentensis]|uniref:hypothetical protein n=1 Tax=Thalassospira lucentensis TaxID=168935 RepID=UPI003D2ED6BA